MKKSKSEREPQDPVLEKEAWARAKKSERVKEKPKSRQDACATELVEGAVQDGGDLADFGE